jgi:hypothetical protein
MGEGPGEFQRIETLSRMPGDSIAVSDYWLQRVTILGPNGTVERLFSVRDAGDRVRQLRSIGDSGFVGLSYSHSSIPNQPGHYRMPYRVIRLGREGTPLGTLAVIGGFEGFQYSTGDAAVPFGKDGHLAARGTELVIGSADALEFDRFEGGGRHARRIRVPGFDLTLSPSEVDLALRAMLPDGLPPEIRAVVESMEIPETRPAYSDLQIDSEGCVWAAGYSPRGAPPGPVEWQVFAENGEWLGLVRTPPRFSAFDIGSDYVLGVLRDDLDVEHVQLLRLDRL